MSSMMNISNNATGVTTTNVAAASRQSASSGKDSYALSTEDFYQLMAVQLQNQTMDDTSDTTQFIDQMMQMTILQAIDTFTETSVTQYAASMVGQTVTVAEFSASGAIDEIVGEVTATGVLEGDQVIFVNDVAYPLSQIMAVGNLPQVIPELDETLNPPVAELPEASFAEAEANTFEATEADGQPIPQTGQSTLEDVVEEEDGFTSFFGDMDAGV